MFVHSLHVSIIVFEVLELAVENDVPTANHWHTRVLLYLGSWIGNIVGTWEERLRLFDGWLKCYRGSTRSIWCMWYMFPYHVSSDKSWFNTHFLVWVMSGGCWHLLLVRLMSGPGYCPSYLAAKMSQTMWHGRNWCRCLSPHPESRTVMITVPYHEPDQLLSLLVTESHSITRSENETQYQSIYGWYWSTCVQLFVHPTCPPPRYTKPHRHVIAASWQVVSN